MVVVKRTPGKRVRGFTCTPGRDARRSHDRRLEILQPACRPRRDSRDAQRAFTLTEVLVAVVIVSIVFVTLFTAFSSGFAILKLARENLRATQILVERMEGLRLYNWNQLVYSNMLPTDFQASFSPDDGTGTNAPGMIYSGTMTIGMIDLDPAPSYAADMRQVTVSLAWTKNGVSHQRSMSTFVSRNGIQNYVFAH